MECLCAIQAEKEDRTKVSPTVLVATTTRWVSTARLVNALANAGCAVDAVFPFPHPLAVTNSLRRAYPYHGLIPLRSFAHAIASTKPDLILPGDDLATRHLHELYFRERSSGNGQAFLCALIERSFGCSDSFPVVYERSRVIELAREVGVRVPKTDVIANKDDLRKWADQSGFPAVLKANGTSGGEGVRIVHTLEEALKAFRKLQAPPLLARVVKRALIDRDLTLIWPLLLRRRSIVNVQAFVPGREATSLVACWNGTVLASLHFEVLNKEGGTGPASVLRLVENPDMSAAAEKVVRRLNLSGLHGFDFMLEDQTRNAYLTELNPRTTQVGHLTLGPGRDLPAALCAAVSGSVVREAPKVTENNTITLFPNEWLRNPASAFLRLGYHDVPWEEPELVRACARRPPYWRAWYSKQKKWYEAFSAVCRSRL
jgi:ATP-grasp domain-containing protein/carbamoyl-phosphate synthase L subunit-like protein